MYVLKYACLLVKCWWFLVVNVFSMEKIALYYESYSITSFFPLQCYVFEVCPGVCLQTSLFC